MEGGDVMAWGRNNYGQLGLGDTTDRNTPTKVSSLADANVTSIATGGYHSAGSRLTVGTA